MSETYRIAVDIGGTFTDLQVLNEATGESRAHKTPTTPNDPSEGLMTGVAEAAARFGFSLGQVSSLMHGTTIATNAVLERKLPKGALIATAGFEDVLEIGRHVRKQVYSVKAEPRALLVPRHRRFGVKERINARGEIAEPLDEAGAREAARRVADSGAEVCAVALLHAYANPAHERRLADILREAKPGLHVSLSSDVSPEIREFERTSTVVLNALLMPVVAGYLVRLKRRMAEAGLKAPVYLVQSNGGVTTPDKAAEQPARLLLSGPSGGALAAETLSRQLAEPNLIAIDMGGTSFDVSIVHDGRTRLVTQGEMDGLPVRLPMLEIRTIGAGGGSLAVVDPSGRLRVGPESAGAEPGPACYGRGGEAPTVTDANVALGRIDPAYFLGGAMTLDAGAARRALEEGLANRLGLTLEQAAEGVLRVANANMAAAVRLSLFEKGLDPKDFALISFGGAAGLHACDIAAELGCGRVVFPRDPGTLSAWGMLFSDIVHDLARSRLVPATAEAADALAPLMAELKREGEALLARDGVAEAERAYRFSADFRYRGQAYEIVVPIAEAFDAAAVAEAARRFHDLHMQQYAHAERHSTPEIVTLRLAAVGRLPKPGARPYAAAEAAAGKARRICFAGAWRDAPVRARETLRPAAPLAGPAVIEEPHSTILLPPGWSLDCTAGGDLVARAD